MTSILFNFSFFFQAEDGIRDKLVTGVQTCALPICIKHNFGMARPEGYRKCVRLMEMAERFGLPVLSLADSAGAYPGIGAEERGQAEAIARSTDACMAL